jgi:hypothetical protein
LNKIQPFGTPKGQRTGKDKKAKNIQKKKRKPETLQEPLTFAPTGNSLGGNVATCDGLFRHNRLAEPKNKKTKKQKKRTTQSVVDPISMSDPCWDDV